MCGLCAGPQGGACSTTRGQRGWRGGGPGRWAPGSAHGPGSAGPPRSPHPRLNTHRPRGHWMPPNPPTAPPLGQPASLMPAFLGSWAWAQAGGWLERQGRGWDEARPACRTNWPAMPAGPWAGPQDGKDGTQHLWGYGRLQKPRFGTLISHTWRQHVIASPRCCRMFLGRPH